MWLSQRGDEVTFTNCLRWTLNRRLEVIILEHLRQGVELPVFLVRFRLSKPHTQSSIDPHLCKRDSYTAQLYFGINAIALNWQVTGPYKNEEINYCYKA
jgi:hypothetical protein